MAMQALRDGASKGVLKFFLLGILVLAGGGLVFTDVGGFFRGGGVTGNDVIKIGKETVSINSFDRVARRTLARLGITPAQAYKLGYLDQILGAETRRRSLLKAANDSNVLVGKDYVIAQIQKILGPAIESGMSTEQALDTLLRNQGIAESELTSTIISERTISLFGDAMKAGAYEIPYKAAEKIYAYDNETRNIRYLSFQHKDFKDIEEASDEQLTKLYDSLKEFYASPERRTIKLATIKTDTLAKTLTIEESELRDEYDDAIDTYTTPASRTVGQAVFKSEEAATAAAETVSAANFAKSAKAAKGDVIPAKLFTEDDILDELKDTVFSAEVTGIIGPIKTPLGWTVLNLSKISKESVKSFDSVKAQIRDDMVQDQLIDEIYKLVDEVDEFFATGGTVEDAQKQFEISIETFENLNRYGQNDKDKAPLTAAAGQDAPTILESAFELDEGTTGPAFELSDTRFVVVNTATVTPKAYTPFDEVKTEIKERWTADQRALGNRTAALDLQKENADAPITDIAKQKGAAFKAISTVKRDDEQSPLSPSARASVFGAKKGEHFVIDTKGGIAIAEVTNITKPKKPSTEELTAIAAKTELNMQNELLSLYLIELQKKYPVKINERLLAQIYGEQPNEGY